MGNNKRLLRVAVVGLRHGHLGSVGPEKPGYIHTFNGLDDVEIVGFFEDTEPERLEAVPKEYPEANSYTDLDDMIANEHFEVALIGLPANEVPAAGIKLAAAGKHIYMEKQFARRSDDLAELARVAKNTGVKVFPGYPSRLNPVIKELRSIIAQGLLGKPISIETRQITSQVRPGGRDPEAFSYKNETQGGGIVHHLGCHNLDVMRSLMGEIKAVQAMIGRPVGYIEAPLEDVAMVALEFENGAYGSMHAGYVQPTGLKGGGTNNVIYRGTEGWAEWPFAAMELEVASTSPDWKNEPVRTIKRTSKPAFGYGDLAWIQEYVNQFMEDLRNGDEPELGIDDAMAVARVIDAIYESSDTGRRIEVKYDI